MVIPDKYTPRVPKNHLLLIAGLAWGFAGVKILSTGIADMTVHWFRPWVNIVIVLIIFAMFYTFVFTKIIKKHLQRIKESEKPTMCIFAFFNVKGYLTMLFMIALGVSLRKTNWLPPLYLGTFYTGLGLALGTAAICFFREFWRGQKSAPRKTSSKDNG